MSFEINSANEFVRNSDGPIHIDTLLSSEEKQAFEEALAGEREEIHDMTRWQLSVLLHQDILPNITQFSPEVQEDILQLANIHPEETETQENITPELIAYYWFEEADILALSRELMSVGLNLGQLLWDFQIYIEEHLGFLPPEQKANIILSITRRTRGIWEIVADLRDQSSSDEDFQSKRWILNGHITEVFDFYTQELFPSLQIYAAIQRWEVIPARYSQSDRALSSTTGEDFWEQNPDYIDFSIFQEEMVELLNAPVDEDGFFDEWFFSTQELLSRDHEAHNALFEDMWISGIDQASLLSEEDQRIESEAMFYYLCAVWVQCLPYAWAIPWLAADSVDVFSTHDATLSSLQAMGLVPAEYQMEKWSIDHLLAGAGIILTAVGLQWIARSRKLARAIEWIQDISWNDISVMLWNFSERMGFWEWVQNALRGVMWVEEVEEAEDVWNILHSTFRIDPESWERISTGVASDEILRANGLLSDTERLSISEEILWITLSPRQQELLLEAHNLPQWENYRKWRILMSDWGFTRNQAQILMDQGIAGTFDTWRRIPDIPTYNFSRWDEVIIPRSNGSTSRAVITNISEDGTRVEVRWEENWRTLIKNVDISVLQRSPNISQELLNDIHSLDTWFIIELYNWSRWFVTSRSWNLLSVEISHTNWSIEYRDISIENLISYAENISDIVRFSWWLHGMPRYDNIESIIQFIRNMNTPWIMWDNWRVYTKWYLLSILNEIQWWNYWIINNLTRTWDFREIVRNAVRLNPPRIQHEVWNEVYVKRSNGTIERGWNIESIWPDRIELRNIARPQMVRRCDPDEIYSITQIEWWQIELTDMAAEFQRRRLNLLQSELSLSEADFQRLFDGDFGQRNVWNCYFVAAMHSLRESPDFELIMRSSIQRVDWWYQVQIPMLSRWSGRTIFVGDNDILPQINRQYGQADNLWRIDNRRYLNPIDWPVWYQILEMAYIIQKFSSTNRLLAEWGFWSEVLSRLSWNNFISQTIWRFGRWMFSSYWSLAEQNWQVDAFLEFARTYDPRRNIATANSIAWTNWHNSSYIIDGIEIFHSHAYSIMNIDRFNQIITLRNPWAWERPIMMNFRQFLQAFSQVDWVQINYESLLNNI